MLTSGPSGSTSDAVGGGKGTASALTPIITPGDPLTGGGDAAEICSVSSSDESVSGDSVIVSGLTVLDSISELGGAIRPLEGLLPPTASALGFLSDRLTIGWEKLDMAGVDEFLVKSD